MKFYRFPSDSERKAKWIAAINRKDWYPTEYSWICSEHFVSGEKSNNQFAPNYVPTIFKHVKSPMKRRMEAQVADFQRRTATKKRRIEQIENSLLAEEQRKRSYARKKKPGDVKRTVEWRALQHFQMYQFSGTNLSVIGKELGMLQLDSSPTVDMHWLVDIM